MLVANAADHTANGAELQLQGPKVAIEIAVPAVLAEFLERSGLPVPPPRRGFALIEIGRAHV